MKSLKIYFQYALFSLVSATPMFAVVSNLDLYGTGETAAIDLAFPYCHIQPGEELDIIYQSGYKIYSVAQDANRVVAIGYLNPCIGIVVKARSIS